jgi:tetratricopeptide (TPR) repeat protein/DNA-binding transcriptional ArsR family regulator
MTVLSYTPSHCDPAVLERLTTARSRREAVERLTRAVTDELGRSIHQHQLLIGPRGSGKTHVLTLLVHRLRSAPEVSAKVLPIVLPEEVVARQPADLLVKIIDRLLVQLETEGQGPATLVQTLRGQLARLKAERDHGQALTLAMAVLEEAAEALGRLLVPVMENLDALLYAGPGQSRRSTMDLQWGLRRALQESPGVMLVAAAPTSFGEVTDPAAAFHDFFRVHTLDELSSEEMVALIRERVGLESSMPIRDPERQRRLMTLKADFEQRAPGLHGLLALTGGLPRFGHLVFDLLVETEVAEIRELLSRFLDDQTPYFQSRLDPRLVPEAELEVLDLLACSPGPLNVGEIAIELRGVTAAAVATYLTRLRERGLVRERRLSRRSVRYDLSEPLFRLWRRFRIGPSEQEQILVLAEFVAAMFTPVELMVERMVLASGLQPSTRLPLLDAALSLRTAQLSPEPLQSIPPSDALEGETARLIEQAEAEFLTGSLRKSFILYKRAIDRLRNEGDQAKLSLRLSRLSDVALRAGEVETALTTADEGERIALAIGHDLGRGNCIQSRGEVLLRLGRNQEALDAFQQAEELFTKIGTDAGQGNCIMGRGDVLLRLGRTQEALDAFQQAEELFTKVGGDIGRGNCIRGRGEVLLRLGRKQEALDAFQQAEELYKKVGHDHGQGNCIMGRGEVLFRLGRTQEALDAFQQAEELFTRVCNDIGRGNCRAGRGRVLASLGRLEEGLAQLVQGFLLSRKCEYQHNIEVHGETTLDTLAQGLDQISPESVGGLIERVAPVIAEADGSERIRAALIRLVEQMMRQLGAVRVLELLPRIDAHLPASRASLLRPVRLAAEVKAGIRLAELPEEPAEVHRAVTEFLRKVEQPPSLPSTGQKSDGRNDHDG